MLCNHTILFLTFWAAWAINHFHIKSNGMNSYVWVGKSKRKPRTNDLMKRDHHRKFGRDIRRKRVRDEEEEKNRLKRQTQHVFFFYSWMNNDDPKTSGQSTCSGLMLWFFQFFPFMPFHVHFHSFFSPQNAATSKGQPYRSVCIW